MNNVTIILFFVACCVTIESIACTTPKVIDTGLLEDRDFAGQPVYSEKLYTQNGDLCGKVELIKEHVRGNSIVVLAMVKYFDINGKIKLSENYSYTRSDKFENININSTRRDGRLSWVLIISTLPKQNEEETLLEKPSPILGYLRHFIAKIPIRNKALKQKIMQRVKSVF